MHLGLVLCLRRTRASRPRSRLATSPPRLRDLPLGTADQRHLLLPIDDNYFCRLASRLFAVVVALLAMSLLASPRAGAQELVVSLTPARTWAPPTNAREARRRAERPWARCSSRTRGLTAATSRGCSRALRLPPAEGRQPHREPVQPQGPQREATPAPTLSRQVRDAPTPKASRPGSDSIRAPEGAEETSSRRCARSIASPGRGGCPRARGRARNWWKPGGARRPG